MTLETTMAELGAAAQAAGTQVRLAREATRNSALIAMANHVRSASADILSANESDMQAATEKDLSAPLLDRLKLEKSAYRSASSA